MIDHSLIEEIKYRCPIEDVVSSYVTLKRSGSSLTGLCPFHSEKTPSFSVSPSNQLFYCFGCGAGGDVVTFIMRSENLDYPEAVEFLARRAGIEIPADDSGVNRGPSRSRIMDMNRDAARYFHQQLYAPDGQAGLRYLKETRRLSDATIRHFGLGFAPDSFGKLTEHLRSKGYTDDEMIVGFLCGRSQKTGRPYDYFRNRVIFPIIDVSGNIIAFGGRVMDDSKPKYLNSSDTPAFKKSRNLFALNYAKDHAEEQMILCEGYMDVIALHAAGFPCAVATLGTAIRPEQARLMNKYTKKVVISYDSDEAGQRAADNAIRLLTEAGCSAKVLQMKGAKDPDEFIKTFGADAFRRLLGDSISPMKFKIDGILKRHDLSIPEEKVRASSELCRMAADVYSEAEREVYIGQIAEVLSLPADSIRADVKRQVAKRNRERKREETNSAYDAIRGVGDRINPDYIKDIQASRAEETVLGLLLLYPEHRTAVRKNEVPLTAELFRTEFGARVFTAIMENTDPGGALTFSALGERFTPEEMGRIVKMQMTREALTVNDTAVLQDAVEILRRKTETGGGDTVTIDDLQSILQKKKGE